MRPFTWDFPYASQRMPVLASNVVAASQPLAAQAGLRMLLDGGSAVDAILATAIALTVVEPTMNGIGSDAFALVWDGERLHGGERRGRRPERAQRQRHQGSGRAPGSAGASLRVRAGPERYQSRTCEAPRQTVAS